MAQEPSQPTPESPWSSNNTSSNPSRSHSLRGGRNGHKSSQKVKFSVTGHGGDAEEPGTTDNTRSNIPEIRIPDSEDVADNTLTPPEWVGRTNAAAAEAQGRASRLANRLSSSSAGPRINSGTNTPLIANMQGKHILNSAPGPGKALHLSC